jgi:hypothetical protein
MRKLLTFVCILSCFVARSYSQDGAGAFDRILQSPEQLFSAIDKKASRVGARLIKQSEKYLQRLARQEKKLQEQLSKLDSNAAKELFSQSGMRYTEFQQMLKRSPDSISTASDYISHIDSVQTAISFLDKNELFSQSPGMQEKLSATLNRYKLLQRRFNGAEEINQYLRERQQFLQQQVEKFGLTKQYRKLKQQAYYYCAQVEEIKHDLQTASGIEKRLLQVANSFSGFRNFFAKYSHLGSLFRLPGSDPLSATALQGLPTRDMVMANIQDRFGSGPDVSQQLSQSLASAQSKLTEMKNKLLHAAGNGGSGDMPDFKPNQQKTRKFLKRFEVGANIQSTKSNNFFPVTSDIGLNAGYKLNDRSVIGVGLAYKMGWGRDIRHISVSHQGIGLRSYIDIRVKGGLWISGGAEMNYRSEFRDFDVLNDLNRWQQAALIGITKKYSLGKKRKGNMQLLYDFMAKPALESRWKFRTGYLFN